MAVDKDKTVLKWFHDFASRAEINFYEFIGVSLLETFETFVWFSQLLRCMHWLSEFWNKLYLITTLNKIELSVIKS